jgi:hypothetical protein
MKTNALWIELLWKAMHKTGHGYRKYSMGHTGEGLDRRNDKLGESTDSDGKVIFVERTESKLQRAARHGVIGVRA